MKTIILTGFLPFGDYSSNPTEASTRHYSTRIIGKHKIIGIVLPCTYYGAFKILSKIIDVEQPDAIISTGLSSSVRGIRFETTFRNLMNGKYPDADGYSPVKIPLDASLAAAEKLHTRAKHAFLLEILKAEGIPVELSEDAEAFICNALGYLTAKKIQDEKLMIRHIFIHVPWTDDYSSKIHLAPEKIFIKKEHLYKAIELLAEHILL